MQRFIFVLVMAVISTGSFATAPTSSANKSSQLSNSMGSAWKTYRTIQPKENKNDIEIVYGGEDIKNPALIQTARA